ncbi:WYL domain-containing protein [Paenibacillus lutrae]|uniref:WYL domain-containing protein n=1 Tax=Paenibacillus lutrae TaxID=2078573 RepID=A0A7X3JZE7_9BACL|nr:WYL domain-containing protein [Paenibacillus lutrae]
MKLERLISMIYMLLNNEVLSASALAEKYGVSQRTIYRDIDAICAAGIPVVSYQGVHGGYGIMEEYKMDKSLLGSYDVGSLITILHSMSTVFDDERALDTINRLQTVRSGPAASSLSMDLGSRQHSNELLRLLRTAITGRRIIEFEYINMKNERAARVIEPIQLNYKHGNWYVYGFCQTRMDYREFRTSRMADLTLMNRVYTHDHAVNNRDPGPDWTKSANQEEVVLHFSADALARAMDHFYDMDKSFHDDGTLTITLKVPNSSDAKWLLPVLLSFGETVEVKEPLELRKALKTKLEKILKTYSEV